MTMFQFENLNEKLFNRVVCFAYSYPSGLGGPGTLLMYTEDGEEYLADQRGLVEYDWFKLDEIVPFRDESRFKEYYWGIGVHLYIRNDLYDKVISAMESIEKHYHMMPTVNKVIWPLLEVPEEKVIRIVYVNRKDVTLLYIGVMKMEVSQDLFGVYYTSRTDSSLLMKNVCLVNDSENDLWTTDMNGIQYCEKRNEICFMEGENIHKPEHAENEEWKLLWPICDE